MRRASWTFAAAFAALELLYLRIAMLGDLRRHAAAFLLWFAAAFVVYLAVAVLARRLAAGHRRASAWLVPALMLAGVAYRLTLAGLTPTLSDDIYRYLWDGRVQLAGINPYRYAPDDPAVAFLKTPDWELINHKQIPTIYPPLMQGAFRLGASIAPSVHAQKWLFLVCDLAILALLPWLLARFGIDPLMSVVYAWHPLAVVEVAGSGHNDPLGVFWLLIGLACWRMRRRALATVAFVLSFLSKLTTALLLPFYAIRARRLLPLFIGLIALSGAFRLCSPHVTPGLGHYSRQWEFNSSFYSLAAQWLGSPLAARLLGALIVAAVGVVAALKTDDALDYTLAVIQAAILVTPVLEPWYLLWLIPLLCVRPSTMWLIFSGLVMLSYAVLIGYVDRGVWQVPLWVKWVEYGPLYGWLASRAWTRAIGRA